MRKRLLHTNAMLLAVVLVASMLFGAVPAAAASSGGAVITRADIEAAVVETAWAYYLKGAKIQYDSEILTPMFSKYYGGSYRLTENVAPEFGTDDTMILSVCSDYCHKVWLHATDYAIMGGPLNTVTRTLWENSEAEGLLVARWWRSDYTLTSADRAAGITENSEYNLTTEEMRAFIAEKDNLRPGDIMVADGHALLYVGEGYVIDCAGSKYNMTTGFDRPETTGSLEGLHRYDEVFLTGTDPVKAATYMVSDSSVVNHLVIVRPSLDICVDDGDGDLSNDVVRESDYELPAAAQSRLAYPGLEINRTVDISPFGTVEQGETLTYTVAISNGSGNADYVTYHTTKNGVPYSGTDYQGLVVREVVPAGTTLIDTSSGAAVSGGDITWTLDIPAGQTVNLTYTVRADGDIGDIIVSEGGFVADIPSNSISNTVGGKKLNAAAVAGFEPFYAAGVENWLDEYNICVATTDLDFAERVYAKAAGVALDLPTIQELFEGVFKQVHLTRDRGAGYVTAPIEVWMYSLKEHSEVDAGDKVVYDMIVDGYIGGKSVYVERPATCMNEFNFSYLEPGDILVYANLSPYNGSAASRWVTSTQTIVYLGNEKIAIVDSKGNMTIEEGLWARISVWRAFLYDFFVALRPSEAIEDVNTQRYDPENEPDYSDWTDEQTGHTDPTEIGTVELNKKNQTALAGITITDLSGLKTIGVTFGASIYESLDSKIQLSDVLKDSVNTTLNNISIQEGSGGARSYRLKAAAPADYEKLYAMLVPGYYGGPWIDASDVTAPIPASEFTLDMLKVGDIVVMGNTQVEGNSGTGGPYMSGVYQGGGNMLISYYVGTKASYETVTLTDASFAQMLEANPKTGINWMLFYILRPSLAYYDINDTSYEPSPPSSIGTTELNAANKATLAGMTSADLIGLKTIGVAFGASIYGSLDSKIQLSDVLKDSVNTTLNNISTQEGSGGARSYRLKAAAPAGYEKLYAMLVPGYYGGPWIDASDVTAPIPASEFTLDMLKVGDIVVMGNTQVEGNSGTGGPYMSGVYQGGGNMLISYYVGTKASYETVTLTDASFAQMLEANPKTGVNWMLFYILRPSLAYYDINDTSYEPPEDSGKSVPLSQENKEKIAALGANSWLPGQRNLSFAGYAYERIGLNIRTNGIGTLTFASALDAIFIRMGSADSRDFLLMREAPAGREGLYNMLLPGYYGGPSIYKDGVSGLVTEYKVSDLEIGDIIVAGNWATSHYCAGIYQGSGQFLFSNFDNRKVENKENWYTATLDDDGYAAFLNDDAWKAFYVLRPYLGYANINERIIAPTTNIALQPTLTATDEDAPVKLSVVVTPDTSASVVWSSDHEAVATVSEDGTVSFVSPGTANIIAAVNGARAICVVTVGASKNTLRDLVDSCASYQQSDYTADSWQAFAQALAEAEAVLTDDDATQAQVDGALDALNTAISGLTELTEPVEVSKDSLQDLVDSCPSYQQSDYTADSWQAFAQALAEAEAVLTDDDATQAQVDEALDALNTAISDLTELTEPEYGDIPIENVENGNKQATIHFPIASPNGEGYVLYLSENGEDGSFAAYGNVNYNAHGAHVKKLDNGKTYYAYVTYAQNGSITMISDVVELRPG